MRPIWHLFFVRTFGENYSQISTNVLYVHSINVNYNVSSLQTLITTVSMYTRVFLIIPTCVKYIYAEEETILLRHHHTLLHSVKKKKKKTPQRYKIIRKKN